MRFHLLWFLFCFAAGIISCPAQNLSFERADSAGNTSEWNVLSGHVERVSAHFLGFLPFTATDQSYFIKLENDTLSSPSITGRMSTVFPFADTPHSIFIDVFYNYRFTYQRYGVEVTFSKWRGGKRDTLMRKSILAEGVTDSNNSIVPRWTEKQFDLGAYADTTLPDTATILITCDAVLPLVNTTYLLADHIHFGKWLSGVPEKSAIAPAFSLHPNPAGGVVYLEAANRQAALALRLFDSRGNLVREEMIHTDVASIDISQLAPGIYIMQLEENGARSHNKLIVTQ